MAMGKCLECGREVSTDAQVCPGCGKPKPTTRRMSLWAKVAAGFLVVMMAGLCGEVAKTRQPPSVAAPPPPRATAAPAAPRPNPEEEVAAEKRLEACRGKLKLAGDLKLLYGLDWKAPEEPRVLVGPTFINSPIDVKEGLAETVSCFVNAGRLGHGVPFDLRHWKTGEPIYRFSGGRLTKV